MNEVPATIREWHEQRRLVALINRYQADLKRDPSLASPPKNHKQKGTP